MQYSLSLAWDQVFKGKVMSDRPRNPLTLAGYEKLSHEYDELFRVVRPRVVKGIADAAAEGDRSENAEYIYGKKHLREIDKRLAYLFRLLSNARPVSAENLRGEIVCFASTVIARDDNDIIKRWTIVGDGEADAQHGTISCLSPVGKALLGRSVGDFVEIELPQGTISYEVVGLRFGDRLIAGIK